MTASKAAQKLTSIASSWPVDPFRPNIQLKKFSNSLSAHPKLTSEAVHAVQLLQDNAIQKKVEPHEFSCTNNELLTPSLFSMHCP